MSTGLIDNGSNKIYDETEIAQNFKEGEAIEKEENHRVHKTFTSQENPEHVQEDGNREAAAIIDMKFKKKKALLEFRCMVEDAVLGNYLLGKPPRSHSPKEAALARSQLKKITLWGVPLLPSKAHEGTDIVLLKFLKAKDYKVHDAFEMLRKTLKWRRDYLADLIQEDGLDPDVGKLVYSNCKDREGRPLYYNVCGAFKNRELPKKLVDLEDLCDQFIRLEVKFMEKGIKELNFKPGGANSIVQIIDLKNSKPPDIKKFRVVSKKTVMMLQDNYPELMHRNIIINVPFWYYAFHTVASKFLSPRCKRKFVFARPAKVTKTLLKFISPENLPVEYGGLYRENDDFFPEDRTSELIVRKNTAGSVRIPVAETGVTMMWDLTVLGWDVSYKEEFIPDDEGSYRVLLQSEKEKKGGEGESMRNSFYISEPGKIVITIDNVTLKNKRVYYRFKTKPAVPMYIVSKE